ncbi:MAG: protein kinase [Deltaproteobacteria bacterium]|nr:protein kinase [Deltaproteobacteria bacterium]
MEVPVLFGNYLLHQKIASGSTADVFLAQTTGEYSRLCVVKRIRREVASLPEFASRFRQDAQLLVRLSHGCVVQVLEIGAVEQQPFVAMEAIDGVELADVVESAGTKTPLPPEFALHIGVELTETFGYLQRRRQENAGQNMLPHDSAWSLDVMLSFDGLLKVVGVGSFGAVRLGQRAITRVFDSPGYAAPEVILKQHLDHRADIFSLGLLIWECLSGKRLVASAPELYIQAILSRRWEAPLVRRPDVPGDIIRLVAEMLEADPARRIADPQLIRRRLVAALRRIAPDYGSAAVSRLLWQRCEQKIQIAEQATTRVVQAMPTLQHTPQQTPPRTNTYGKADLAPVPIEPKALTAGDRIPGTRYRVIQSLGRGGSAEVFAAQHIDLDRRVAIKILSPQLAQSPEAIRQFRTEARACSLVTHPNIVDVIDFGELDDGRFFFAMELLDGRPLSTVLAEETSLSLERTLHISQQLIDALQAVHEQGIVHRDVKPENVMVLGSSDTVKVLDFGVMAKTSTAGGSRVGTPGYMAPEQVQGAAPAPTMDVYGAACLIYELLAGVPPYPAESVADFIRSQAEKAPPALRSHQLAADVPIEIEQVLHRALERDAQARYPSMAAFAEALSRARQAARPPAVQPKASRRMPLPMVAAVMGFCAAVIAVGLTLHLRQQPIQTPQTAAPKSSAVAPVLVQTDPTELRLSPEVGRLLAAVERAANDGLFTRPAGESALDQLQKLERIAPANARAAELRREISARLASTGDRLKQSGFSRAAQTLYREALAFTPNDRTLLQRLEARRSRGRPPADEAEIAWLLAAVQQAISEGRYVRPRGQSALRYLQRLKQIDPRGQRTNAVRSRMGQSLRQEADRLWREEKRDQARELYRMLVVIDPADRVAGKRATELSQPNKPRISERDRQRAATLLKDASTAREQGRLGTAAVLFRRALEIDPRQWRAIIGLAGVAFDRGQYSRVIALARRATAINRRATAGYMLIGDAAYKLLRYRDALQAWQRVVRLAPGHTTATRRIVMVKRELAQ